MTDWNPTFQKRKLRLSMCVEPAGLCGRCTGVAVPIPVAPRSPEDRPLGPHPPGGGGVGGRGPPINRQLPQQPRVVVRPRPTRRRRLEGGHTFIAAEPGAQASW